MSISILSLSITTLFILKVYVPLLNKILLDLITLFDSLERIVSYSILKFNKLLLDVDRKNTWSNIEDILQLVEIQ